jgi:hypothetical protein
LSLRAAPAQKKNARASRHCTLKWSGLIALTALSPIPFGFRLRTLVIEFVGAADYFEKLIGGHKS